MNHGNRVKVRDSVSVKDRDSLEEEFDERVLGHRGSSDPT